MKKYFVFILFLAILIANIFAVDYNICIYPDNNELSNYIDEYFVKSKGPSITYKSVKNPIKCSVDDILTEDVRLLEYICNKGNIDLLLVPKIENISGYYYLRLYSYDKQSKEFALEYKVVNTKDSLFGFEAIKAVNSHIVDTSIDLTEKKDDDFLLEKLYSTHDLIIKCSNTVADVYLNDEYLGTTPYIISDYYVPSIIKLNADGYKERVVAVDSIKTNELEFSLISIENSGETAFKNSQKKYYISFAAAIVGLGSRVAYKAANVSNPTLNKVLNIGSIGLAGSSLAYLGFNIYNYFKSTQNTTP